MKLGCSINPLHPTLAARPQSVLRAVGISPAQVPQLSKTSQSQPLLLEIPISRSRDFRGFTVARS
jgi:hypothetical protein